MGSKKAYLKIEQMPHNAPGKDSTKTVGYGLFRFTVALYFEESAKWLIGRSPDLNLYPYYEKLQCVYLPSPYIARTLGIIHVSKEVYNEVHIIQVLSERQTFIDIASNKPFTQKPLRNNDRFTVANAPFYRFRYVEADDKETSEDLSKETVY